MKETHEKTSHYEAHVLAHVQQVNFILKKLERLKRYAFSQLNIETADFYQDVINLIKDMQIKVKNEHKN